MATRSTNAVINDANRVIDTWTANPDFRLGTVTLESFTQERDALAAADAAVESMRTDLAALMNSRDDKHGAVADLVLRARAGFKAVYGPDSTQYEQSGGTRKSERASGLHRGAKPPPK